jgi:hypothetical protein
MNVLVQHIPHAIPVVAIWGLLIHYWLVQRRVQRAPGEAAVEPGEAAVEPPIPAPVKPPRAVRRAVAVRGLLALGPLVGALGTGLVVYAVNLGQGHAGAAVIWVHVGLSLLALLLVVYKIADIGVARMRASMRGASALRTAGSIVLLALWVPLLASGVLLLISPSEASFTAYAHLIASVWWTGLLLWHLRRYLARAVRLVVSGRPKAAAGVPGMVPAPPPLTRAPAGARATGGRGMPRSRPGSAVPTPGGRTPSGHVEATGTAAEDNVTGSLRR